MGGGFSFEVSRAAPMRTSSTVIPGAEDSARLTRRMQEPQCIPSIRSVNSVNAPPPVFDDTPHWKLQLCASMRCAEASRLFRSTESAVW